MTTDDILLAVAGERALQDAKWGVQNHDDLYWLAILMEEVGELAKELCDGAPIHDVEPGLKGRHVELVQIAAVCVAWLEAITRRPMEEKK